MLPYSGWSREHLSPPSLPHTSILDYLHHLVTKGENSSAAVSGFLSCQLKKVITQKEIPEFKKRSQHANIWLHPQVSSGSSSRGGVPLSAHTGRAL